MNPQLLNTEISLNMTSISAGLKTHGEATIRHRQEIGTRMDALGRWPDSHRSMIEEFQKANQSRISQIKDLLQGANLTVSVQKLMKLAISPEQNLGLLKDAQQEEARTLALLQELRSVDQGSESCLSHLSNLWTELDCEKYLPMNENAFVSHVFAYISANHDPGLFGALLDPYLRPSERLDESQE